MRMCDEAKILSLSQVRNVESKVTVRRKKGVLLLLLLMKLIMLQLLLLRPVRGNSANITKHAQDF